MNEIHHPQKIPVGPEDEQRRLERVATPSLAQHQNCRWVTSCGFVDNEPHVWRTFRHGNHGYDEREYLHPEDFPALYRMASLLASRGGGRMFGDGLVVRAEIDGTRTIIGVYLGNTHGEFVLPEASS